MKALIVSTLAPLVLLAGCASMGGPHAGQNMPGAMHGASSQTMNANCPMMGEHHGDGQPMHGGAMHPGAATTCPMAGEQTQTAPAPTPDPHGH